MRPTCSSYLRSGPHSRQLLTESAPIAVAHAVRLTIRWAHALFLSSRSIRHALLRLLLTNACECLCPTVPAFGTSHLPHWAPPSPGGRMTGRHFSIRALLRRNVPPSTLSVYFGQSPFCLPSSSLAVDAQGCMGSSVEFRGEPQAVQLLLDPRALALGPRSIAAATGERAWAWSGTPTGAREGHPSGLRESEQGEDSGTGGTPGDASHASALGSGAGLLQRSPATGVQCITPPPFHAPPSDFALSPVAPSRWSAHSVAKEEKGTRTGRAHAAPEDLLLHVLGSIRLQHTVSRPNLTPTVAWHAKGYVLP